MTCRDDDAEDDTGITNPDGTKFEVETSEGEKEKESGEATTDGEENKVSGEAT